MKNSFLYFLLTPFGFFLLIRCFFPILWCSEYLFVNTFSNEYFIIVFIHLIYLLFQSFLIIIFYNKIKSIVEINRDVISTNRNYNNITFLLLFILSLFFIYGTMPLLLDGGSDALVIIGEDEKFTTWFNFGTIRVILIPLLLIWYFQKNLFYRYLILFYILIFSILDGKKGGVIILINNFFFIHYFLSKNSLKINFKLFLTLTIFIIISILYAVLQFNRTIGLDIDLNSIFLGLTKITELTYNSFTSYLEQMISMNGLKYAVNYSDQLGSLGIFKYFFNSFTKLLFGFGIDKSIGPFLNYELFGSSFPNGVNPILFFELIFISGNIYFSLFSFLILYIVFHLIYNRIKKLIIAVNYNYFDTSIHYYFILFYLSLLSDTLNAIRALPFIFVLFILKKIFNLKI